jgi:uncharacterized protein YgbK (DUF1537 family)
VGELLISFYGDDFTGSTDAMESLARSGVRTVLFSQPPTPQVLARYPGIRAFGVAGMSRSMPPEQMEHTLRPVFAALHASGAPIVHYKICSTFDSSPTVGSIGRAIDVGMDVFGSSFAPLVVGAPPLGRYCVFGNLFARCGTESQPYRLDRHPSMSKHPTTPMDEADLCRHLVKQTSRKIGLFDVLAVDADDSTSRFDRFRGTCQIGLIDVLYERHLAAVGRLLDQCDKPLFVVGSSGVEAALAAYWRMTPAPFPRVESVGPILVLCGSCSPVTGAQIAAAEAAGFASISFHAGDARQAAASALRQGLSAIIHTWRVEKKLDVGQVLSRLGREVLEESRVRRVLVAGGDTSGQIAAALGIESMEMIGELTRGAPLCRATAPNSPADGVEIVFKGGQIGPQDFFVTVQRGQ